MLVTVLCASNVSILKRWYNALDDKDRKVYIAKDKGELFDYFNSNKTPITLILENKFNDEENEEFLKLLRRTYTWVKVCVLSYEPNLKEASDFLGLGVKGYGNIYMNQIHFKDMTDSVWNGVFWFYPKFLESFSHVQKDSIDIKPIGYIQTIKSLVIARTDDEEHIVSVGEDVIEDELIMTPYQDSFVEIKLKNSQSIQIDEDSKILLDESVFKVENLSFETTFDEDRCNQILSRLGTSSILPKKNMQKNEPDEPLEDDVKSGKVEKGIEAFYSGKFEEYDIYLSKNLPDFIVIKDKVQRRDGCDLISSSISKCIFLDINKTYHELIKEIG